MTAALSEKKKSNERTKGSGSPWARFDWAPAKGIVFPKIFLVIPVRERDTDLGVTLQSVLAQDYSELEIVVIDSSKSGIAIEAVHRYGEGKVRIYPVTGFTLYEVLNKGISLARGDYLCFLYPGDAYLGSDTLKQMMTLAVQNTLPAVVYGACLLREASVAPKNLFRPMTHQILRSGHLPSALQSIFWRKVVFDTVGQFSPKYKLRGTFELLCRVHEYSELRVTYTSRVITDLEQRKVTRGMIATHFYETLRVVFRHFGFWAALKWTISQRDGSRWLRSLLQTMKVAFLGRS